MPAPGAYLGFCSLPSSMWARRVGCFSAPAFPPSSTRFGHSSFAGYRLLFRKINRLREGLILKRVVKRHLLGARIRENAAKTRGEGVVQTIIGPESEDTAGAQMCGKPGEPLLAVESGVLRIEQKVGVIILFASTMSPAMAAGVTKRLWEIGDIVDMLEGWEQSGCARC